MRRKAKSRSAREASTRRGLFTGVAKVRQRMRSKRKGPGAIANGERPGPVHNANNGLSRPGNLTWSGLLDQNDNQRIQRQRLDQRHADDEGDSDRSAGARIARRPFASRCRRAALTETATCRRNPKCNRRGHVDPVRHAGGRRPALRERHRRKNQRAIAAIKTTPFFSSCFLLVMNLPPGGGSRKPWEATGLTLAALINMPD